MAAILINHGIRGRILPHLSWRWPRSRRYRILLTALVVAISNVLVEAPHVMLLIMPTSLAIMWGVLKTQIVSGTLQGLSIALCLELFWWVQSRGAPMPALILVAALLLMVPAAVVPFEVYVPVLVSFDTLYEVGLAASPEDFGYYLIWNTASMTAIAAIYLVRRRHVFEQQTRRESVAREWQDANRAILESRMQAIQARVEPQLLFDALASMREFYALDLKQGEVLLEALIDFLRRGLPRTRSVNSTIGLEIELLRSYVDLQRTAHLAQPTLEIDCPPSVMPHVMAAGVLQPLLAAWLQDAGSSSEACFRLAVRLEGSMVTLRLLGPKVDLTHHLDRIEAGLKEIHGAAQVTNRIVAGQLECKLEYPDDIDQLEHATT